MTITYSLDVANTRFCGFTKLLGRWKGSIYKILWKEFLVFITGYSILSITYRHFLSLPQKQDFENMVIYFETFIDFIPLSFVLGFYVSLVIGRWWSQFDAIPWPDRLCYLIASYVHGADERSRTIRRTMGRYLILLMALTFQGVSTAVKKRFPTTHHLVTAGIMTKEERTIYERLDAPYGKWWLPAQWFSALAVRAKKEGRIKDSIMLDGLLREFLAYRSACGTMFNYDWISVPLVYTQVVTLATYSYSLALMVGRQYLDPSKGYDNHKVDIYVPIFTLLQFFFYVGWLKVAEQIVNPYGEDDDDFELNWCLDRNCQIVYLLVDHFHAKHPKLRRDIYWDDMLPQLPQTKITAKNVTNPQLGSAFNLEVNPSDAEFLPMDTVLEEDSDAHVYSSDSVKQNTSVRYRPSFLVNFLNSTLGQNVRRRSTTKNDSFREGHINQAFVPAKANTPAESRKSSVTRVSSPTHSRTSSSSYNTTRTRHKVLENIQTEIGNVPNGGIQDECGTPKALTPVIGSFEDKPPFGDLVPDSEIGLQKANTQMPSIPEEPSRVVSNTNLEPAIIDSPIKPMEDVQNLVAEASKVLEELNRVVTSQGHSHECELKGYESCCSLSSDSSDEDADPSNPFEVEELNSVAIDMNRLNEIVEDKGPNSIL